MLMQQCADSVPIENIHSQTDSKQKSLKLMFKKTEHLTMNAYLLLTSK